MDRRDALKATIATAVLPVLTKAGPSNAASPAGVLPEVETRLAADLAKHASFGSKRSCGPGDRATASWIGGRLGALGFKVLEEAFELPSFDPTVAELRSGAVIAQLLPHPIVVPTPAGGITAPAVLVREPYEAKAVKGRIAILVLPYSRYASISSKLIKLLLDAAIANKAAAILLVTTGPTGLIVGLNTKVARVADVPVAIMAPKDLPPFFPAVEQGTPITLRIEGRGAQQPSWNIIAKRVAGPRWLVISTPRTGWFQCVGERGTGTAVFLELCRWAAKRFPDLSLMAINAGGHELDFTGMHRAMDAAPPAESTAGWAHIGSSLATRDTLELADRTLGLLPSAESERLLMASGDLIPLAKAQFQGISGLERPIAVIPGAGELSAVTSRNYRAFGVIGLHRYFHTTEDGLDKVDAALLLPVLKAHQGMIEYLVRT